MYTTICTYVCTYIVFFTQNDKIILIIHDFYIIYEIKINDIHRVWWYTGISSYCILCGRIKQKQYCICHKMSSVLHSKYSTVVNKFGMDALISHSLHGKQTHCYSFPCTYTWIHITSYMDL